MKCYQPFVDSRARIYNWGQTSVKGMTFSTVKGTVKAEGDSYFLKEAES